MNNNQIIDACINKVKSLIKDKCEDHTPYQGACGSCGSLYNYKVLPSPDTVIEALEELKFPQPTEQQKIKDLEELLIIANAIIKWSDNNPKMATEHYNYLKEKFEKKYGTEKEMQYV